MALRRTALRGTTAPHISQNSTTQHCMAQCNVAQRHRCAQQPCGQLGRQAGGRVITQRHSRVRAHEASACVRTS
eukprot:15457159-Alexandrium_andersonii.AAC.1